MSISPLNKNAMKVSRRLTGDFTNIALPLKALTADSVVQPTDPPLVKPAGAQTTFRVVGVIGSSSFPFKKAQLTIALEAEKVRSSETSDEGVDGLIGQEMMFDTDLFIERTPQFRLKEKDVTMSPDFGRSAKVGEGQLTLNTTHTQFPSTFDVDISVRNKVVGTLQFEVTYQNLDLEQVVDEGLRGKVHGFKNFTVDGDFVAVQSAAVEWANCLKHAIHVVNYTLTSTDIGYSCTVWYKLHTEKLLELKDAVQTQKRHIAERRSSGGDAGSSPSVSKKSPLSKSPRSPSHKKSSKRRESSVGKDEKSASTKDKDEKSQGAE